MKEKHWKKPAVLPSRNPAADIQLFQIYVQIINSAVILMSLITIKL